MNGRAAAEGRRIRSLRPAKPAVDATRPLGTLLEEERSRGGGTVRSLTVFLAGAECPFACSFCDLWRHTLDVPTPPGALPRQLASALAEVGRPVRLGDIERIKLYNASNFFDRRAVPEEDRQALADLLAPFAEVTVECHPRLVGEGCLDFAARLAGRLEVAMGLETVHPGAFDRLNKGMSLEDFDRAASRLIGAGLGVRAFVLVGCPGVPPAETAAWAVRSAAYAFERGAEVVALIPVRGGNGELERLAAIGDFQEPRLGDLEEALDGALMLAAERGGTALADLWDLERFAPCPECRAARRRRLERMNLSGEVEPRVVCTACGGA